MQKTFSESEISEIAHEVIEYAYKKRNKTGATIVALSGDLGAGKTTLVQAIGKYHGITRKMISPTFVLLKTYKIKNKDFKRFHHIDVYRLDHPDEVTKIGWQNLLIDKDSLILIEWPEKIGAHLPKQVIKIELSHTSGEKRKIRLG